MKCDGRHDKNYHDMVAMDYKDIIVLDYYHDDSIAIWNNKIITSLQRVLLFVTLIIESWNQPSGKKGSCIFCKFGSRLPLFSLQLPLLLLKVAITSATLIIMFKHYHIWKRRNEYRSLPSGTIFDKDTIYFTGNCLHTPLRPLCNNIGKYVIHCVLHGSILYHGV